MEVRNRAHTRDVTLRQTFSGPYDLDHPLRQRPRRTVHRARCDLRHIRCDLRDFESFGTSPRGGRLDRLDRVRTYEKSPDPVWIGALLFVGEGGLEPPRPYGHWHLKPARLPFRHSPERREETYHGVCAKKKSPGYRQSGRAHPTREPRQPAKSYRCGRSWISCNHRVPAATRHVRVLLYRTYVTGPGRRGDGDSVPIRTPPSGCRG